jgi:hypothetical protein
VDIAAPGVSILSTVNSALSANGGAEYRYFNGTSMAAPHAAGVAALIYASSYGTSAAAVRDRLFSTADAIGGTGSAFAHGRINAARAVQASAVMAPTSTFTHTATPVATNTTAPAPTETFTPAPTQPAATNTTVPTVAATHTPNATVQVPATATRTSTPVATAVPPARPTRLSASAQSTSIQLSWTASSTAGVTYNVYTGTTNGGAKQRIATGVSSTSYDDASVTIGLRYFYVVRAQKSGEESTPSNEVGARVR